MRKFLSLILIFLTYWMPSWLVTDIHGALAERGEHNQPHPIFSAAPSDLQASVQSNETADPSRSDGCRVCSYDHGGHFGQILTATVQLIGFESFGDESAVFYPSTWLSLSSPPKLRPPIA